MKVEVKNGKLVHVRFMTPYRRSITPVILNLGTGFR